MVLRESRQREVLVVGEVPVRQMIPNRDVRGVPIRTAGDEGDPGGPEAPRHRIDPPEKNVKDDTNGGFAGGEVGGDEVSEVGFEGLGGVEDGDDEGEWDLVSVLNTGGEAVVGGVEGELHSSDVGGGGGGGGEFLAEEGGVERSGEKGDSEVGFGVEAKCELHEWAEMALC